MVLILFLLEIAFTILFFIIMTHKYRTRSVTAREQLAKTTNCLTKLNESFQSLKLKDSNIQETKTKSSKIQFIFPKCNAPPSPIIITKSPKIHYNHSSVKHKLL